jgi:glycosyltransferase involved in cell wall biosynthesis
MRSAKNLSYKNRLIEKAKASGVTDFIEFGNFTADVEKTIIESDIVLNFSESESFSMTCAEASYYGKPVIATRCGGPEEIIADQESGILVDKENITQMAEAIVMLSNNAELQKQFGEFGKSYVRQKFSPQHFKKTFTSIL